MTEPPLKIEVSGRKAEVRRAVEVIDAALTASGFPPLRHLHVVPDPPSETKAEGAA